jgi:hypothetical protein
MTAHFPELEQAPTSPVSSTDKTDRHDIAEILLKVALNTIKPTNQIKDGCHCTKVKKLLLRKNDHKNTYQNFVNEQ